MHKHVYELPEVVCQVPSIIFQAEDSNEAGECCMVAIERIF